MYESQVRSRVRFGVSATAGGGIREDGGLEKGKGKGYTQLLPAAQLFLFEKRETLPGKLGE